MFKSEILSKRIGNKIAKELNLDNDNEEVIIYGLFTFITILYNILLVMIFGMIFNVLIESLIVSFVISILRKSSGGAHANSHGICAMMGTFVSVVIALISKLDISINNVIIIGIIAFAWAYYNIFKLSPVDSPNKPIKTDKKKKRLKKSSIIILSIYLIIVTINIGLYGYTKVDRMLVYSICILGGVIWQILSLTKVGHIIVKEIDTFLNKILKLLRGGKK